MEEILIYFCSFQCDQLQKYQYVERIEDWDNYSNLRGKVVIEFIIIDVFVFVVIIIGVSVTRYTSVRPCQTYVFYPGSRQIVIYYEKAVLVQRLF